MKDRKGDMPDSRSLRGNYLPSCTEVDKRRMRGVQRTPTHQKLGKRDIWLAAETKHLFPTRYRECQVMSKWGLCHHQGRKKKRNQCVVVMGEGHHLLRSNLTNVNSCILP